MERKKRKEKEKGKKRGCSEFISGGRGNWAESNIYYQSISDKEAPGVEAFLQGLPGRRRISCENSLVPSGSTVYLIKKYMGVTVIVLKVGYFKFLNRISEKEAPGCHGNSSGNSAVPHGSTVFLIKRYPGVFISPVNKFSLRWLTSIPDKKISGRQHISSPKWLNGIFDK